jgi:uncharacterized integral membrane protein (TIGR00698 family)
VRWTLNSDGALGRSGRGADLYGEIWLAEHQSAQRRSVRHWLPGLGVVTIAAAAAAWLSDHYAMPIILAGLLIGLALNFLAANTRLHAGMDLCATTGLRWGIVLLGTQVTLAQIAALGITSFAALIAIVTLVIAAGVLGARLSGNGTLVGLLAGGATAICGASAALAIYALIGRERLEHHRFTFTLVVISLASAVAMSFYPLLAAQFQFSDRQAGFLMGAAIHDVAQSLGAGYSYSPAAGEVAAIVKLTRVALLAPVVAVMAMVIGRPGDGSSGGFAPLRLPWFIWAFLALVLIGSAVPIPAWLKDLGLVASKVLLLFAVIAAAMRSSLDTLLSDGWRGSVPVMSATLASVAAAFWFARSFL